MLLVVFLWRREVGQVLISQPRDLDGVDLVTGGCRHDRGLHAATHFYRHLTGNRGDEAVCDARNDHGHSGRNLARNTREDLDLVALRSVKTIHRKVPALKALLQEQVRQRAATFFGAGEEREAFSRGLGDWSLFSLLATEADTGIA